jgi:hypothetical protein
VAKPRNEDNDVWNQYPPCIQGFIKDGVGEGQRNNAMFNIAVMEHLKNPKTLRQEVYSKNKEICKPPIDRDSELEGNYKWY